MNAVDTNVLVYAVDLTEPTKSLQAVELLRRLAAANVTLVVPWQVVVEFLACLRRWEGAGRITRDDTLAYLDQFIYPLPVVHPTIGTLRAALELSHRFSLSHWDSLLLAACSEAGVNVLYSEDLSDGVNYNGVQVVNPFVA